MKLRGTILVVLFFGLLFILSVLLNILPQTTTKLPLTEEEIARTRLHAIALHEMQVKLDHSNERIGKLLKSNEEVSAEAVQQKELLRLEREKYEKLLSDFTALKNAPRAVSSGVKSDIDDVDQTLAPTKRAHGRIGDDSDGGRDHGDLGDEVDASDQQQQTNRARPTASKKPKREPKTKGKETKPKSVINPEELNNDALENHETAKTVSHNTNGNPDELNNVVLTEPRKIGQKIVREKPDKKDDTNPEEWNDKELARKKGTSNKGKNESPFLVEKFPPVHVIPKHVLGHPDKIDDVNNKRADAVRQMFVHAYGGYERWCMGKGELKPISLGCDNWLSSDMGLTIIDSLDTMLIMGLDDMYSRGKRYLEKNLDWNKQITRVSVFEITIRCLGGLLSAHHLTGDEFMLNAAVDLANRLLPAFDGTDSGIPHAWINLNNPSDRTFSSWTGGQALLAEYGSVQLEFAYLAHLTKNRKYFDAPLGVYKLLIDHRPPNNLYPFYYNPSLKGSMAYSGGAGIGAWADSFYEYVLKFWVLTGMKDDLVKNWYLDVSEAVMKFLAHRLDDETVFMGEKDAPKKTDHLACFAGGMFALGADLMPMDDSVKKRHVDTAKGVGKFCHDTYVTNPTGLPCDQVEVYLKENSQDVLLRCDSREYIMRPEAVESWFYLYRTTGDEKYREWGWAFYQAIENLTKTEWGYGGLNDATSHSPQKTDKQQSFFLAETLKYLFLLFSPPDVVPLDKFVFNTEAHIFPIISDFAFKLAK